MYSISKSQSECMKGILIVVESKSEQNSNNSEAIPHNYHTDEPKKLIHRKALEPY